MATSLEIRDDIARILKVDLVGPEGPGDSYEKEALEIPPSCFYLTVLPWSRTWRLFEADR